MQRQEWIDSARGGAILLVVIGHSGCPEVLDNLIYSFHMPLFFIVSGYLFNFEKWSILGYKSFVYSRFNSYIRPYFILCGVNYLICLIIELFQNGIHSSSISLMGKWLFGILYVYPSVDYMPNCTPLWFLVALFLSSILFYMILKVGKRFIRNTIIVFIAMIDALLSYYISEQLPWCLGAALIGVCCMYFGYCLRDSSRLECGILVLLPLICIGFMSAYINGRVGIGANIIGRNPILFWVSALSLSFVFLSIAIRIGRNRKLKLLNWYGKNTIIFMGFNYFFNLFTQIVWNHTPFINQYQYDWYTKSILCVLCISLIILLWNAVNKKYPQLSSFVGF